MDIKSKAVEAHGSANSVDQQRVVETKRSGAHGKVASGSQLRESDTVELSLGRSINSEFVSERAQRVAELKALIASGQYNPSAKAVAGSVAAFIDDEIWFENLSRAEDPKPEEV